MKYTKEQSAKRGKRYVCQYCGERYHMDQNTYSLRTLNKNGLYKRCCTSDGCESIARGKLAKQALKLYRKQQKDKLREAIGDKKGKQSQDPLQKAINKIARLLDKNKPCLARPFENQNRPLEAGHIFSVGAYPALRYNLWNIHGQSNKSNRQNGGESDLMQEGIERRYGIEQFNKLQEMRRTYKVLKLTNQEKKEALTVANRIARELESGKVYTRDEVNELIGIYK
jgi:hypothetical protein